MRKEKVAKRDAHKSSHDLTIKELVFYVIGSLFILGGIILVCFGIASIYAGGQIAEADAAFKAVMKLDFRFWGLIIFLVGVLIVVITLCVNAKKTDRIVEKENRRQQRLGMMDEVKSNAKPALNVVEVETKPVEEEKAEDKAVEEAKAEDKPTEENK